MPRSLTLLLVDPEESLFRWLETTLSANYIHVFHATEEKEARYTLSTSYFDLLVIDQGLLLNHESSFIKTLRDNGNQSYILSLSHTGTTQECIDCLSAGADDYLARPFVQDELTARIRSLARYATQRKLSNKNDVTATKGLQLYPDERSVFFDGSMLSLTQTEYRILEALSRYRGSTISHEALLEELHGHEIDSTRNSIEVHISAIRRKFKEAGAPATILTRRGYGYSMK